MNHAFFFLYYSEILHSLSLSVMILKNIIFYVSKLKMAKSVPENYLSFAGNILNSLSEKNICFSKLAICVLFRSVPSNRKHLG